MQGRLIEKFMGRYQAHPIDKWTKEFQIAKKLKLECIEFIFDFYKFKNNPLMNQNGINKILKNIDDTNVIVKTICADYFMEAPLHSKDKDLASNSIKVLKELIFSASKIGVTDIVIPCVDQSSIKLKNDFDRFIENIQQVVNYLEIYKINLALETDLPPNDVDRLLQKIDHNRIKINYDTGNSASLGYNVKEELSAYGHKITDIHIKDRLLNGGPVVLGRGNANFELFFTEIKKYHYSGPYIMQAYRDDEGLNIFNKQLNFIKPFLEGLN